MSSINNSTGYGPSHLSFSKRLYFDGNEENYELWEVKFLAHLRLQKLDKIIDQDGEVDGEKNKDVFSELVQYLDDKSLMLVVQDAKGDGRKAIDILREHYSGSSKPRIISLYCDLTSLKMQTSENVTDYVLRAERAATRLKSAKESVSDSLLIAMILKGLPESFKAFSTVITQNNESNFQNFKISLRSNEENEKARLSHCETETNVMKVSDKKMIKCYKCGNFGHKSFQCRAKNLTDESTPSSNSTESGRSNWKKRWCSNCKSDTHNTNYCRKNKTTASSVRDNSCEDDCNYNFKISVQFDDDKDLFMDNDYSCNMLIDSGATAHILNDESKFVSKYDNFDSSKHYIELADGSRQNNIVKCKGDAQIKIKDSSGCFQNITLNGALCIPSYKQDILSVQSITEKGSTINFNSGRSAELITPNGNKFEIRKSNGKLYYLDTINSVRNHSLKEWHEIMGHCNVKNIVKLENVVHGMKINDKNKVDSFNCEVCTQGKMFQYKNHKPDERATKPLELIHSDLSGPITPESKEKSKYVISFVDDYSNCIFVYFLNRKNDVIGATKKFLADISPFGAIKRLRSDNGTEYTSGEFKNLMIENKICQEFSAPYSPHQNGTAERHWRSLFDMARCLLVQSGLPKFLWNYAVRASAYIRNRCYNERTGKTPFQLITNKAPNINNMHIFGEKCFAYVQDKQKLDPRSQEGVFIGYDPNSPAYLVYFAEKQEVRRVRCVKFFGLTNSADDKIEEDDENPNYSISKYTENGNIPDVPEPTPNLPDNPDNDTLVDVVPGDVVPVDGEGRRYPSRTRTKPKYLDDYYLENESDSTNYIIDYCYRINECPKSYQEAISSPNSQKWKKAMEDEMKALEDHDTYDIIPRPKERSVVGGRWVFAIKEGLNSQETFKARYVAKGYSQVQNVDYCETFSPTARMTSVRMLMDIAVQGNMIVHQMDVKTAYLNAKIDCEIYVEQPEGFIKNNNHVFKLKKSLYGLKQSGRNWNNLLHTFLTGKNFIQSLSDHCVYVKHENNASVIMLVWVDDLIIASTNIYMLTATKQSLCEQFKMKDLGVLSYFLGIEFNIKDNTIEMNQSKYTEKILVKFQMTDCHPKAIPCDMNILKAGINNDSKELSDPKLYREIVGNLIYLMTGTRPDICYVVTILSKFMSKPTYEHLNLCKYALKYLKGTVNYKLTFVKSNESLKVIGYCDSDWGGSLDRRSISGYCYKLSDNGSLISWKSKQQRTVALSTCEAEYMALTYAVQEGIFLRQLLSDMTGSTQLSAANIFVDNQGAIELAKNPVYHQRSKHIDIRYHYLRTEIKSGKIILHYIPSNENIADIFTKPVSRSRFQNFSICK